MKIFTSSTDFEIIFPFFVLSCAGRHPPRLVMTTHGSVSPQSSADHGTGENSTNQGRTPLLKPATTTDNGGNIISSALAESSHPTALLFHFGFRTTALFIYLFSSWFFTSSFVFTVVLTVILLALDFWTVKNVTGRLLVGRRWWNSTTIDGSTVWTFEARPSPWKANPSDSRLFWVSLYGYTAVWGGLGVVAIFRFNFSWLLVVAFALTLNLTNLLGYLKCDREAQSQVISNWGNSIVNGFVGNRLNNLFTTTASSPTNGSPKDASNNV